jgi:hypothetical protein
LLNELPASVHSQAFPIALHSAVSIHRSAFPLGLVDDFEDVAVDRLAEEEPLEGGRAKRFREHRSLAREAFAQRREVRKGVKHRDMAPELTFEAADLESFNVEHMKLLPAGDVEPERLNG